MVEITQESAAGWKKLGTSGALGNYERKPVAL